jgi:hypothetical protein
VFSNAELGTEETGSIGLFAAYSMDGGKEWHPVNTIDPDDWIIADGGDNLVPARADPSTAWDDWGNLFITYVTPEPGFPPGSPSRQVPVAISIDGGMTFSQLETLGVEDTDMPTIAVGPIIEGESSVWVTYKDFSPPILSPLLVQGAKVNGLGMVEAFGPIQEIPESDHCYFNDIAVGPTGQVLTVCQRDNGLAFPEGPNEIVVNFIPDGLGGVFDEDGILVGTTNVGWEDELPVMPEREMAVEVGIVYDRSKGPNKGRAYLLYTDEVLDEFGQETNNTNIFVTYSDNNGQDVLIDEELVSSWSDPVCVNDDTPDCSVDDGTNSQFLPRIAMDQKNGFIAVSWHDARNDNGDTEPPIDPGNRKPGANNDAQLWASESTNGGITFEQNVQVSAGTSDENAAEPYQGECCLDLDYGDYTGLAYHAMRFYPAWADNSNSTGDNPDGATSFEIYTAKVLPEPSQLLALGSGVIALWGLSFLRVRNRCAYSKFVQRAYSAFRVSVSGSYVSAQ